MGEEESRNAVYISATLPPLLQTHTMPQINLISCHNCSENVTS